MANSTSRISRKFQVTVAGRSTVVLAETKPSAIDKAIPKLFGSACFWHPDSGVKDMGQVFKRLGESKHSTSVTQRVSCAVTALASPSRAFLRQEDRDRAELELAKLAVKHEVENAAWLAGYNGAACPADAKLAYHYKAGQCAREQELAERAKQAADEETMRAQAEHQVAEWAQSKATKLAEQLARTREAVQVELARLQGLDVGKPISDPVLAAIIRNTIARDTFPHGIPFGEWKRQLLAGDHPDVITTFLHTPRALEKLSNKLTA